MESVLESFFEYVLESLLEESLLACLNQGQERTPREAHAAHQPPNQQPGGAAQNLK